jgi:hypothetical protein
MFAEDALIRTRGRKEVPLCRNQPSLVVSYGKAERKDEAMIARFDHRPMLTAVLVLSTTVLFVVVITLATLLITAAPPAATSSSESGGNPSAAVPGSGDFYGDGWNNYGHDADLPRSAQTGNGADSAVDRHAKPSSSRYDYYNNHYR